MEALKIIISGIGLEVAWASGAFHAIKSVLYSLGVVVLE